MVGRTVQKESIVVHNTGRDKKGDVGWRKRREKGPKNQEGRSTIIYFTAKETLLVQIPTKKNAASYSLHDTAYPGGKISCSRVADHSLLQSTTLRKSSRRRPAHSPVYQSTLLSTVLADYEVRRQEGKETSPPLRRIKGGISPDVEFRAAVQRNNPSTYSSDMVITTRRGNNGEILPLLGPGPENEGFLLQHRPSSHHPGNIFRSGIYST
ncbi:hypothetical protein V495_02962 [Pseudogymnoascus sp. VKM F-4514 (FW-929)]|nr:hypothetical protein V495_02962 [Pseudogymnoascus sp. VKM F-4514 (FW-929)]KFY55386.1 hypothetical protein V497_07000 [Pseudogymnoascus sp. VKM F-4516 (FW-969)]